MKNLLLLVVLFSLTYAEEIQNETSERKKQLAKKYDYSKKVSIKQKKVEKIGSFQELTDEERILQENIAQPSGSEIDEDKKIENNKKENR